MMFFSPSPEPPDPGLDSKEVNHCIESIGGKNASPKDAAKIKELDIARFFGKHANGEKDSQTPHYRRETRENPVPSPISEPSSHPRQLKEIAATNQSVEPMLSVKDFLEGPRTRQRIERICAQKFNYKPDINAVPPPSIQGTEHPTNANADSLWSSDEGDGKYKAQIDQLNRRLALEKAKNLKMIGDVAKWASLANRIRTGDDGDNDDWNSRQGAFEQLMGELEGWRLHDEEEEGDYFGDWIR